MPKGVSSPVIWNDKLIVTGFNGSNNELSTICLDRKNGAILWTHAIGSDQMIWPGAITSSIEFLNALDFLSKEEKEMILYKNAKSFLGIKD